MVLHFQNPKLKVLQWKIKPSYNIPYNAYSMQLFAKLEPLLQVNAMNISNKHVSGNSSIY